MSCKLVRKFKFSENEKVLCYQGPLIYEAKCLQSEVRGHNKHFYYVHYSGWNKHWDEWVNETRVLKHNLTNLIKQKEVLKRYGALKNKRFKLARAKRKEKELEKSKVMQSMNSGTLSCSNELEKNKTNMLVQPIELQPAVSVMLPAVSVANSLDKASVTILPETHIVNIIIPKELQEMITDDWDFVSKQKLLFRVPAKITVQKILKKYLDELSLLSSNPANVKEMILGLQEYFNVMLGSQLLYKFERPQYGDMLTKYPNLSASQIYGAFHFLRFFVRLDVVLSKQNKTSEENIKLVLFYVHDCLQFLKNNKKIFFNVEEYETAPAEYHRRAMT